MVSLRPFWRYYGGKWMAAPWYPAPEHDTIIEPFAGAAGYSCRYPDRQVILIDKSPIIAGIWDYLIHVSPEEILSISDIPDGGTVDDLPACQEARWLAGFWVQDGVYTPRKSESTWAKTPKRTGSEWSGWNERSRQRIASQVPRIRHWRIICGEYTDAPDIDATWYIDPPYNNRAGSYYPAQPTSFDDLGRWCQHRRGLAVVCENAGAEWLPFRPLRTISNTHHTGSKEVVWMNRPPRFWVGVQESLW